MCKQHHRTALNPFYGGIILEESESDIAWYGYIDLPVVCLHWVALSSDKDQREFSLSRSLKYNSTLKR